MHCMLADFEHLESNEPSVNGLHDKDSTKSNRKQAGNLKGGGPDLEDQSSRRFSESKPPERHQSGFLNGILPAGIDLTGDEGETCICLLPVSSL